VHPHETRKRRRWQTQEVLILEQVDSGLEQDAWKVLGDTVRCSCGDHHLTISSPRATRGAGVLLQNVAFPPILQNNNVNILT